MWPTPQSRHFYNPAWNYVGLAINAAMQMSCHSPLSHGSKTHGWKGLGHIGINDLSPVDQSRTWLGCFWIGNVTAAFCGLPPPMSTQQQMRSIDKALSVVSNLVPAWWCVLFSILKITNAVMDTLGDIEDYALHFSLTQMFDDQLNELKRVNSDVWVTNVKIEWCNAKLYLYALTFTIPGSADTSHNIQIQLHRQAILPKALEAASNLITELQKLSELCTSDSYPGGLLHFVPKPYFAALFNATTFLFRYMVTYMSRTPSQESAAMDLVVEAHKIFQSFPEERELTRAAIHVEMLMEILRNGASVNLNELVVNNKLGASIMFDALFQACRQRNIDPRTGKALTKQEWKTVNDLFAQRLPEVPMEKKEDHNEFTGHGINGVDVISQTLMGTAEENPTWWQAWDNHIDHFQVGVEQWGVLDMEQSTNDYGNLGGFGLGGFTYT